MEKSDAHGRLRCLYGLRIACRWADIVHDGLGNAEEHQADPHTCSEEHRKPRAIAVGWATVVRTKFDFANI